MVACVLDLTFLGDLAGLELLEFRKQLDGDIQPRTRHGAISWSYDSEVDALYFHINNGPGQVQQDADAVAYLDASGMLVRLEIQMPSYGTV